MSETGRLPLNVQESIASSDNLVNPPASSHRQAAWYVTMNNARPPMDDPAVRRAISHAYDTETVVEAIVGAGAPPCWPGSERTASGIAQILPLILLIWMQHVRFWPNLAIQRTSWPPMPISIAAVAGSERFNNIALSLATNLNAIGLKAEVAPARWSDIVQAATTPRICVCDVYLVPKVCACPTRTLFSYIIRLKVGGALIPGGPAGGGIYYDNQRVVESVN